MSIVSTVALTLGLLGQAALAGANLFEAVVDVPNWRRPDGLKAYRVFVLHRDAGAFYRVLSPLTIVLLVTGLIAGWQGWATRDILVGVSVGAAVLAEVMTVAYFFPRNRALFTAPEEVEPGARSAALVGQWGRANLLRIAVVVIGWCAGLIGASRTLATSLGA